MEILEREGKKLGPDEDGYIFVVAERYEKKEQVFAKLHSLRYRFMAVFGKESAKPFEELRGVVVQIMGAARRRARLLKQRGQGRNPELSQKLFEQNEILFDGDEADDPIHAKVEKIITDIEAVCGSYISQHSRPGVARRVWQSLKRGK